MKALIFITLKILEVIAILIIVGLILALLLRIDHYTGYLTIMRGWFNKGKISVGLVCQIITGIYVVCLIPYWIKKNKEWTNKIHSKIKNKP